MHTLGLLLAALPLTHSIRPVPESPPGAVDSLVARSQDDEIDWGEEDAEIFETPLAVASRHDDRPPLGVPWAQVLEAGELQLGYRYELQSFDGLRDGRDDLSSKGLSKKYGEIPEDMSWQSHTVELTYGWDETTSVFASLPFVSKDLEGRADVGGDYEQESSGVGDLVLGVIHACCENEEGTGRLVLHFGLGLPTGSIDEEDDAPAGGSQRLPYPMQLGTGTFDAYPGFYWVQSEESWAWGAGASWRLPIDRNDEGYAPGEVGLINLWASRPLTERLVGTVRIENVYWGDYHGEDDELDGAINPLNDEHRQGGHRTDLHGALAWDVDEAGRNRLELDLGLPLAEWLDGPQMSTEWLLGFGWRYSF